ncbi:hypothetical protein ALI144C_31195 [Actinosynnema sp. ALI-1.44]|nr:hypothetical protein ALI144C_31195 [Actinosynnema sp. ALI-1.44]
MEVPPLNSRVPYLWLDSRLDAGDHTHDCGWTQHTRIIGGISITVLDADATLRTRVLESARPVLDDTDCPAYHAITDGPTTRPAAGHHGLTGIGAVESVTICRYAFGDRPAQPANPVLSLSRIGGDASRQLVQAILAAPEGSGPNTPGNCAPHTMYGDEALVLTVRGTTRTQEVFVRYSGCDAHGFDDGHTRRRLTADALRPLLSGPHQPQHGLQRTVAELLQPRT